MTRERVALSRTTSGVLGRLRRPAGTTQSQKRGEKRPPRTLTPFASGVVRKTAPPFFVMTRDAGGVSRTKPLGRSAPSRMLGPSGSFICSVPVNCRWTATLKRSTALPRTAPRWQSPALRGGLQSRYTPVQIRPLALLTGARGEHRLACARFGREQRRPSPI